MQELNYMKMKKADFNRLPHIEYSECFGKEFDSLIIIPSRSKHDSGFMCMSLVGCNEGIAECIMGGGSDVINLDGIGGYGEWNEEIPHTIPPKGWAIDCIPCGYLRIFATKGKLKIGSTLSNFEVYCEMDGR